MFHQREFRLGSGRVMGVSVTIVDWSGFWIYRHGYLPFAYLPFDEPWSCPYQWIHP